MIQALSVLLPVAYLTATALFAIQFLAGGERPVAPTARRAAMALALVLHLGVFVARGVEAGGMPELSGWTQVSALVLTVVAMHLWTARGGQPGTGLVVFTLGGALQLMASALGPLEAGPPSDRPAPFYLFHVFTILIASAALVLSGVYGLLYMLLFGQMRARRFGPLFASLPSLEELNHYTRRAALAAFVLLLAGINGGIWWAHASDVEGFSYTDPFVLVMVVLSIHFAIVAFSGRIPGLTARRASVAATGGLVLLLASLVVLQLVRAGFHAAP
ncbi:MAG: hypothetical protein AAFZ65_13440 [Planctomycetota bacterium]